MKIYLAKHSIPNSTYPAVTSSFFVESLFDTTVGSLVMLFALTQGVLPSLPSLPNIGAFDLSFWADHPRFALFTITFLTVGLLVLYAVLSIRAVVFWRRVRQGVVILTDFRRYLRQVAAWQGAAWLLRFFSFYFFLEAFNIGGSVENALLVMSVQALSTLTPFTPGRRRRAAGAARLRVPRARPGGRRSSRTASGQQIAIAAFNVAAALIALFYMAGTTDFRSIIRRGREDEQTGRRSGPARPTPAKTRRNRCAPRLRRDPRAPRARASRPRGRSCRIASRICVACSSDEPDRSIVWIAATVMSTASLIALSAQATRCAPCICSANSPSRRCRSSGSPNMPPNGIGAFHSPIVGRRDGLALARIGSADMALPAPESVVHRA